MKLIAACDKNWAIGFKNDLLARIPEDMKFFRETTTGHVVVMGRRTLESFPGGRPLPDRTNLVLSRNEDFHREGVRVFSSKEALLEAASAFASEEVFVIGGEQIYRMLLDVCDEALITRIHASFEADAWFPDLEMEPAWEMTATTGLLKSEKAGLNYELTTWRRVCESYGR